MTVFSWGISRAALLPLFLAAAVVISPPAAMAQGNSNERAAFESAKELGTPEAFNAFLSNYSTGFYADLARAYLNKLSGAAAAGTGLNSVFSLGGEISVRGSKHLGDVAIISRTFFFITDHERDRCTKAKTIFYP